jgi:hypothetical protein
MHQEQEQKNDSRCEFCLYKYLERFLELMNLADNAWKSLWDDIEAYQKARDAKKDVDK